MKRFVAIITTGLIAGSCLATPLSPEEALLRVNGTRFGQRKLSVSNELLYTASSTSGVATAYVFGSPEKSGFTLLSADTRAIPVLGYSDSASFDADNLPDGLKWLLEYYGMQLQAAAEQQLPDYAPSVEMQFDPIAPLVKTKWDQVSPYNGDCPVADGVHCPTGCVATSLAQVMNYFQFPEAGEGRIIYPWGSRKLILDFASRKFDWDNMLDTYSEGSYDEEEAAAVAYLMKAAGYSVQMDYSSSQSGAYSERIIEAMTKYFNYDGGMWYATRNYYSQEEWYSMIYENLRDCGPVIYNGTSPLAGGHSFICDGYDGNGYFHINWGWSGLSDGYFSLDILGPKAQGIGGSLGNFSYSQDAVLGMKPGNGEPAAPRYSNLLQCGSSIGTLKGNVLAITTTEGEPMGWYNNIAIQSATVIFGIRIETVQGEEVETIHGGLYDLKTGGNPISSSVTLNPGLYVSSANYSIDIDLPILEDGQYRAVTVIKDTSKADAPWQPVNIEYGYCNYVYLDVDQGEVSVRSIAPAEMTVSRIETATTLYLDKKVKMNITFDNPSDLQVTACVTPCLMRYGRKMYQAPSEMVTVNPHSSLDYEWVTQFIRLKSADSFFDGQEFTIELINQDNKKVMGVSEEIPMRPTPSNLLVLMDELNIENVSSSSVTIDGKQYNRVFLIPDWQDFTINYGYTIKKGYFDTEMTLGIYEKDENGKMVLIRELFNEQYFLDEGTSDTLSVQASFPEASTDRIYYLRGGYVYDSISLLVGQIQLAFATSGVEEVGIDCAEESPRYYTADGREIISPQSGQLILERCGNKVTKKIWR